MGVGQRWSWLLCAHVAALLPVQEVAGDDAAKEVSPGENCGAYCTAIVLDLVGQERPSMASLRNELAMREGTCSLEDVRRVLAARGVHTRLEELTADSPSEILILQVDVDGDLGHFVVCAPHDGDTVLLYSPPNIVGPTEWKRIRRHASDRVLAISHGLKPTTGAGLAVTLVVASSIGLVLLILRGRQAHKLRGRQAHKLHAAVAGALLLVGCGCGSRAEPDVVIHPGGTIDLGEVEPGYYPIRFHAENLTSASIPLRGVRGSCTCVRVEGDERSPLGPRERRPYDLLAKVIAGENPPMVVSILYGLEERAQIEVVVRGSQIAGWPTEETRHLGAIWVGGVRRFRIERTLPDSPAVRAADGRSIASADWYCDTPTILKVVGKGQNEDAQGVTMVWSEWEASLAYAHFHSAVLTLRVGEAKCLYALTWIPQRVIGRDSFVLRPVNEHALRCEAPLADPTIIVSRTVACDPAITVRSSEDGRTLILEAPTTWRGSSSLRIFGVEGNESKEPIEVTLPVLRGEG